MTYRVFISYETTTGLNLAKHLSASLAKLNFSSFIAERDIKKGDDWRESIDDALNDCEIFILIATNLALKSEEVLIEIHYAIENKKEIIPCKKQNVQDYKLYDAFPIISKIQRIDFKDEFELSDSIIEALMDREVNNQNEDKLSINYTQIEKVGSGGFGDIYKAIRRTDNKIIILNVINRTDHNGKKIITNAASTWLKMKHKNIVELTGVNFSPILYLEQEYCDSSMSNIEFPIELKRALEIMIELCDGLIYAHVFGIVHGDLKPNNILLNNGKIKIADWGFSVDTNRRQDETMVFTPNYASPEQLKFESVDARSDLYQLGIIFYEMLTGKNPNQISNNRYFSISRTMVVPNIFEKLIDKSIENTTVIPPSIYNTEAMHVDSIIIKLLNEDKNQRYQTANELKTEIQKVKEEIFG